MLHKEVGKVVFDGSEPYWTISQYGIIYNNGVFTRKNVPLPLSKVRGLSDYFLSSDTTTDWTDNHFAIPGNVGEPIDNIWFKYSAVSTASDWTTWLSSNPTTVYYALATATDTEITNSALLEQLNFIATLYNGQNNIELVPASDPQASIAIQYSTFEQYNKHNVYIWNDDIDDWQVIIQ